MIYYFDYIRINSAGKENRISRYIFDSEKKQILNQLYVKGNLLEHREVLQSDVSLKDFKEYRINKVRISSLADVTKIKGNEPLKRIMYEKGGKYYCKKSDEDAFQFDDQLLNNREKQYIIIMGE